VRESREKETKKQKIYTEKRRREKRRNNTERRIGCRKRTTQKLVKIKPASSSSS
jgi:hypothetical protein